MERTERVMAADEVDVLAAEYADLRRLFPDHPIIMDENGVVRWKMNRAADWAFDHGLDLNAMKVAYLRGQIPMPDYMAFFRWLGYSLSGYLDVFDDEIDKLLAED